MTGMLFVQIGVIGSVVFLHLIMSTELILERTHMDYFNEKYLRNFTVYIRRTGRKSPYYLYANLTSLDWMGDNVTIHVLFRKFLHNEHKRSFVEVQMNMCDLVNKEPWRMMVGAVLASTGFVCPLPPGTYGFNNILISLKNLPYVWPFEKAMLQVYAQLTTTKEILAHWRIYGIFKRDLPKGK